MFPRKKRTSEAKRENQRRGAGDFENSILKGTMAVTVKQMAFLVLVFSVTSFILGIIAEVKKPKAGTPVPSNQGVTCNYPSNLTVALGYLSTAFLIASTVTGYLSLFYPYKGKSIPQRVLFKHTTFAIFFNLAVFAAGLAIAALLWPTITQQFHMSHNKHSDINYKCPTAKSGMIGGGAFLSLDSSLFWLIALMLANNARDDFLEEKQVNNKGEFSKVFYDDAIDAE